MHLAKRFAPLLLLAAVFAVLWSLGLQRHLSWAGLGADRAALEAAVAAHPVLTAVAYAGVYALAVAASIPTGSFLTITGGLMFGTLGGAALAAIAATAGASLLFLAARLALAEPLARRAGPLIDKLRDGLRRDGFSYLLALRLLPIFPFWLVNLAPALVGMAFLPYVAATAIGIVPATVVFASIGAGLGEALGSGTTPDLGIIFRPSILLPLIGLALLSLAPIAWRRWRGSHVAM
jgi:uncharacterized membrane protein YdjX (TVP38/TMEM64 family)